MAVVSLKSSFWHHMWLWFVLALGALLILPWVKPPEYFAVGASEIRLATSLGENPVDITQESNASFQRWMIDTGAVRVSYMLMGHSIPLIITTPQTWVAGFWQMVYRAIWRIHAFGWGWFYAMSALAFPSAFDGVMVRLRKKFRFEYHNPVYFQGSTHLVILILGASFFFLFAPYALSAVNIALAAVILAGAVWMAMSNMQTGA